MKRFMDLMAMVWRADTIMVLLAIVFWNSSFLMAQDAPVAGKSVTQGGGKVYNSADWKAYKAIHASAVNLEEKGKYIKASKRYVLSAVTAPFAEGKAWGYYNAARLIVLTKDGEDFVYYDELSAEDKKMALSLLASSDAVGLKDARLKKLSKQMAKYLSDVAKQDEEEPEGE